MEDISNKRYITNDELDDATWKLILKIADTYRNLIIENKIIKGGSYYPRLSETDKRGLRAYKEFKSYIYDKLEDVDKTLMEDWLDIFIKCPVIPKVEFDCLVVDNGDYMHKLSSLDYLINLFETNTLRTQLEPYDQIVHTYPEISEDEKIENIMSVIDNLEFTPKQILKLQNKINDYIIENM
tara:strand:- start:10 stop:555 length:546 start_codon:yes stop_codon:yes gene_type:complete